MALWAAVGVAITAGALGCGLALVALFGETFRETQRAELQRQLLDKTFGDGYRAGRADRRQDG